MSLDNVSKSTPSSLNVARRRIATYPILTCYKQKKRQNYGIQLGVLYMRVILPKCLLRVLLRGCLRVRLVWIQQKRLAARQRQAHPRTPHPRHPPSQPIVPFFRHLPNQPSAPHPFPTAHQSTTPSRPITWQDNTWKSNPLSSNVPKNQGMKCIAMWPNGMMPCWLRV